MSLVITATGTLSPPPAVDRSYPQAKGLAVGGSGVEIEGIGTPAPVFDSRSGVQRGTNLFDELNQVIAIFAEKLAVPPIVIIDHLQFMLADLRRQPNQGERVYQP
jgi:hypothetical protein